MGFQRDIAFDSFASNTKREIYREKRPTTMHPTPLMLFPHYISRVLFYFPSFLYPHPSLSLSLSLCTLSILLLLLVTAIIMIIRKKNVSQCVLTHCLINYSTTHLPRPTNTDKPINNSLPILRPFCELIYINII